MTEQELSIGSYADLEKARTHGLMRLYPERGMRINIGMGTCGLACGAAAANDSAARFLDGDLVVSHVGCLGLCAREPLVEVYLPGEPRVVYGPVAGEDLGAILTGAMSSTPLLEKALFKVTQEFIPVENRHIPFGNTETYLDLVDYAEYPFFAKQMKLALRNCGALDPLSIEEYAARGGYFALAHALKAKDPEGIITTVTDSGLRGRGGGGFRTGWKWESAREASGDVKYVICNADEGDPGAYMDRTVMEGDPHSVLEGMMLGAYAIGATMGVIYIRTEYPLAVTTIEKAIAQSRACGLLGKNILGSGFDFDVVIARGSGAFVCGESSALIASIEGKPGEPRAKHTHMAESGLHEKPTVLNNVETWANIPVITERGAEWFSDIGTEKSSGTKVFSLTGNVEIAGLVEVPMGITLREIVMDIGGGAPEGAAVKAIQTGGPSGGCIPAEKLDLPVDFDSLSDVGSMMGSGGMIVMDENACMVDVARFFIEFLVEESCGKCTSCREGLKHLSLILNGICKGKGSADDIRLLEDLCEVTRDASLCGLGTSAPNPVLSTLTYFRDEYEAHIRDRKCPAHVCRSLITYDINDNCVGCGACARKCPVNAISGEKKQMHDINQHLCVKCGQCVDACKFDAVEVD